MRMFVKTEWSLTLSNSEVEELADGLSYILELVKDKLPAGEARTQVECDIVWQFNEMLTSRYLKKS